MKRRTLLLSLPVWAAARERGVCASVDLCGEWTCDGRTVRVPHTWQIEPGREEYFGPATYSRQIDLPASWQGSVVRVECEAAFHTAEVFLNGTKAGEHRGKGYTAFTVDVTRHVKFGAANTLEIRVDNAWSETMLPRGKSYDWTPDGGLYRPVRLLVTPPDYIERVEIDARPDLVEARVVTQGKPKSIPWQIEEEDTGRIVARGQGAVRAALRNPRLWHFDHPHLYRLRLWCGPQEWVETFGIRTIEVKDGAFFLNGERVLLMGVERMAGSHPGYGMAEPARWIEHDHADMKRLNCVFTRVHWMQDRRVLDFCDRHGMLIQVEVPTWGPRTFAGMTDRCDPALLNNGLEQLREMIARDRNHPSVISWGLCNEIPGGGAPGKEFTRALFKEARKLDPRRLLSYASNTVHHELANDIAGEMDFIEWNEYYESWYGGNVGSVRESLARIRAAHPGKMIVISEYGLCECDPKNPAGDERRIEVLKQHNAVYRNDPAVGGLIFFCYNDYRTHIGDKGQGVMKQRVHGVVDVYGNRKPSYDALRRESSPVEALDVTRKGGAWEIAVRTRRTVPAYTLRGYTLRCTAFAYGGLPMEQVVLPLPELKPGAEARLSVAFKEPQPRRIEVDVMRPTGYSAFSAQAT